MSSRAWLTSTRLWPRADAVLARRHSPPRSRAARPLSTYPLAQPRAMGLQQRSWRAASRRRPRPQKTLSNESRENSEIYPCPRPRNDGLQQLDVRRRPHARGPPPAPIQPRAVTAVTCVPTSSWVCCSTACARPIHGRGYPPVRAVGVAIAPRPRTQGARCALRKSPRRRVSSSQNIFSARQPTLAPSPLPRPLLLFHTDATVPAALQLKEFIN